MGRNKFKSTNTSFSTFLIIFLTLGTVIVFAVLLVLSYKSMQLNYISEFNDRNLGICRDLAADISYSDDKGNLISSIEASRYDDVENAFISDASGRLYSDFSRGDHLISYEKTQNGTYITDTQILAVLKSSEDDAYIVRQNQKFISIAVSEIKGTDRYSITITSDTYSSANSEFVSVLLIPTLVTLVFALILFITFIELTMAPIRDISNTVLKVADGNYKARVSEKYTEEDEIRNFSVTSDITVMARTVNTMIESIENQENDRSVFISSIAHDIRTPLTSINGFITAILDGTIEEKDREKYLLRMKSEVEKIRKLVVSMTEASSLSHVDPSVMEEFPIKEVINDLTESLEPQLADKEIELTKELDLNDDTMAYGEAQQLCRVIMNIITNAIKFTPYGGKIIVKASTDKSEHKIYMSVEDSGPGIPEDKRTRVFDSFYKTDPSRKKEGFGLGLYICKQILIGHNQSIHLEESRELGGAKFVFTLPMSKKAD